MSRQNRIVALLLAGVCLGCGPAPRPQRDIENESAPSADEVLAEYRAAARAAFAKGSYLKEQGDVKGALQQYVEAVRLAPRDPQLRLALASLELDVGLAGEARQLLRTAIERYGGSAPERVFLAGMDLQEGNGSAALAGADSALASDPRLVGAWVLRGRVLVEAHRFQEALESFQRADALAPRSVTTLEAMAQSYAGLQQPEQAEATYRGILKIDPGRDPARRALAALYREQGRAEAAKQVILEGLQADPASPEALDAATEAYLQADDLESAAEILESRRRQGGLTLRQSYLYGRVLLQLDRPAAADSALRPLAGEKSLHGVETLLGDIASRLGRIQEAREHYRRALERQPGDCVPATSLALLDVQERIPIGKGKPAVPPEIESELAAASRLAGKDDLRCNLLLGLAYSQLQRFDAALPHLEATHDLDPENAQVLFDLAMAHQELGDYEQALALSKELLEMEPDNAAALNFVGYIQAERGQDLEQCESLIRRALAQEPENGYYVDSLGWVLYQKGEYARAAEELERAVRLTAEGDSIILEHLGDAYTKMGRWERAHGAYTRSRDIDPENRSVAEKLARAAGHLEKP